MRTLGTAAVPVGHLKPDGGAGRPSPFPSFAQRQLVAVVVDPEALVGGWVADVEREGLALAEDPEYLAECLIVGPVWLFSFPDGISYRRQEKLLRPG